VKGAFWEDLEAHRRKYPRYLPLIIYKLVDGSYDVVLVVNYWRNYARNFKSLDEALDFVREVANRFFEVKDSGKVLVS